MKETFTIAGQLFTADIYKQGRNYVAKCIEVPVADFGTTKEEALQNIKECTEEHIKAFPDDLLKIKKEKK